MPGPLDALEKKLKPLRDRLMGFTRKDIEYKLNDLKTYVQRLDGLKEDFAEKVSEAQQSGNKGKDAKDFSKDKEAKRPYNDIQVTYDNITEGVEELQKLAKDGPKLKKELVSLRLELSRFGGAPKDVKTARDWVKQIDEMIAGVDAGVGAPTKIPREAVEVGKKKVEDYYADCMKAAEKMPKKEVKPLPKELDKVGFAKLQKEVNDRARKLKGAEDEFRELKKTPKKGKGGTAEEFLDQLAVEAEEVAETAEMLRKAQKDYSMALRSAPHAAEFPKLEEQARRLAIAYKVVVKKLQKDAGGA